jgi:hypothetical protein
MKRKRQEEDRPVVISMGGSIGSGYRQTNNPAAKDRIKEPTAVLYPWPSLCYTVLCCASGSSRYAVGVPGNTLAFCYAEMALCGIFPML